MKILYKGKGDTSNPDSFRGVVLQNTIFKLFARILNERLPTMVDQHIPECQFDFRKGRSTLQAVTYVLTQIEEALRHPKGKYYTVFVDFKKAFDLMDRKILMGKLKTMIGNDHPLTIIIETFLMCNYIQIQNNAATSRKITQTIGVLQADPISPTLFNIYTADVTKIIKEVWEPPTVIQTTGLLPSVTIIQTARLLRS
jgi:retron-type reverse transcriptase